MEGIHAPQLDRADDMKAPLYSMKAVHVNPGNTSEEGEEEWREKLGLDGHLV